MFLSTLILLIFLSFFFSSSETALTSLSEYKLKKLYNKHKQFQPAIKLWVYKPYRFLITILIGNLIVNLFISSLVTRYTISVYHSVNKELLETVVWIVVTVIIVIFGELLPKIVAKSFPEKISKISLLPTYILQHIFSTILFPIFYMIEKHLKQENILHFTKIDEFRRIVSETSKEIFHKDINEIFSRATKFYDTRVKDIMVAKEKVEMVNISGKDFHNIIEEIIETGKTRVPLYDKTPEKIIGFALVKDLFYLCSSGIECSLYDIIHPILEVHYNTKIKDLFKMFKDKQIHIAKVVDDNKKFCGIVTMEDVIEEITGDILDEYDIRNVKS